MSDFGVTQKETDVLVEHMLIPMGKLIDEKIDKLEEKRNSITGMGCQSKLGCLAGKEHFQEHELKINSDLQKNRNFIESQTNENKKTDEKFNKIMLVIQDTMRDIKIAISKINELTNSVNIDKEKTEIKIENGDKENKKSNDKSIANVWTALKWGITISLPITIGAYLAVNKSITNMQVAVTKVQGEVKKINKVDIENQSSTEAFLLVMATKLNDEKPEQILLEYNHYKKQIEKEKAVQNGQ